MKYFVVKYLKSVNKFKVQLCSFGIEDEVSFEYPISIDDFRRITKPLFKSAGVPKSERKHHVFKMYDCLETLKSIEVVFEGTYVWAPSRLFIV